MPPENQDDTAVIEQPAPTPAPPAPAPAPAPDRGDVVQVPEQPTKEAIAAVAAGTDPEDPADPAAATGADKGKKQGSDHVPIGRFNEVNTEKKALAEKLATAEAEIQRMRTAAPAPAATPAPPPPPKFDEDAQETAYAEALMEGDTKKAIEIRRGINAHIREQATTTATETVRGEMTAKEVGQSLQQASEQAVKDFPFLDTDDGAEALELIMASRDRRIAQGVKAGEALRLAVAAIAPKFAPAAAASAADPAKDARPAAAMARGAADSVAQPPVPAAGVGNRATAVKVNVQELSDEQFDALTPAEKKKLRGD